MKRKKQSLPIDTNTAERYEWGDNCEGWHLLNTNDLSIIKECMPKGGTEELHYHKNVIQFFYVLSGTATFLLDETTHLLSTGQGITVQPMQSHSISNRAEEDLFMMVISSPHADSDRINIHPL